MLVDEVIKHNYERFCKGLIHVAGEYADYLINEMGVEVMTAPASISLYGAYEGGLVEHILLVSDLASKINKQLPEGSRVDEKELLQASLLHNIGAYNIYKKLESEWHNKKGIHYEFKNESVSLSIGERSVKMIHKCGLDISDVVYQAILNQSKTDDLQSEYFTELLGEILKSAKTLTIKLQKEKNGK